MAATASDIKSLDAFYLDQFTYNDNALDSSQKLRGSLNGCSIMVAVDKTKATRTAFKFDGFGPYGWGFALCLTRYTKRKEAVGRYGTAMLASACASLEYVLASSLSHLGLLL